MDFHHQVIYHARHTEKNPVVKPDFDPLIKLFEKDNSVYLQVSFDRSFKMGDNVFVTSGLLGRTAVSDLEYLNYDGNALSIDTDYFGVKRNESDPFPGPFEMPEYGLNKFRVWENTSGQLIGPVCSPSQDHKRNQ